MPRWLFVTGRLAAQSLRDTLEGIDSLSAYECAVLPISVAALMDAGYAAKHLTGAQGCDRVMLPGLCTGDLRQVEDRLGVEVVRGPQSLKDLPAFFGEEVRRRGYGKFRTRIIAEIVDAHKLTPDEILERAVYYRTSGADIIDLGCPVEGGFREIASIVRMLKDEEFLVSVDSFNEEDIRNADAAGVDFLLSVHSGNIHLAPELKCRVVVIPDLDKGLASLDRNIARLEACGVPYIIDPVLRPIGFGFTASLGDFIKVRRKYPAAEMLMGTGNLTELTDADSSGITAAIAGVVAELGIEYVLTTEVIPWARGAVKEMDIARRLMHYACIHKVLPKHLEDGLITVKDPPFETFRESELREMQKKVRDRNYRIFTDREFIYVFNNRIFVKGSDPRALFGRLDLDRDGSQAFYMGRELERAALALMLGKRYIQEEDLRWGYLSSAKKAGNAEP
jgi:dihydropteroate synthase-like protein